MRVSSFLLFSLIKKLKLHFFTPLPLAISLVNKELASFFEKHHHSETANLNILEGLMLSDLFLAAAKANATSTAAKVNSFAEQISLRLKSPVTSEEVDRAKEWREQWLELPGGQLQLKEVKVQPAFAVVLRHQPWYLICIRKEEVAVSPEPMLADLVAAILEPSQRMKKFMTTREKVYYRLAFVFAYTQVEDNFRFPQAEDGKSVSKQTKMVPADSKLPKQRPETTSTSLESIPKPPTHKQRRRDSKRRRKCT